MNEKNSQIIEHINAIKLKLIKYSSLKLSDKVNEYLSNLSRFQLNDEVLTRTEIMNLLKELKNHENSKYSPKASDLMKKIKTNLMNKSEPTKPVVNNKYENNKSSSSTSKSSNSNNKTTTTKPNTNQPQTVKKEANNSTKSNSANVKKPIVDSKANSSINSTKKRPSVVPNEKNLDESTSKKPKLSLLDYKLLKGGSDQKSELYETNRGSTSSSSSSQYEIESDLNLIDNYSPTPKNLLNDSKSNNSSRPGSSLDEISSSNSNSSRREKSIIEPPMPSVPLTNILSNGKKFEVFEPIRTTNSFQSNNISNNNYNSSGMKNTISKFTSNLMTNEYKADNGPSTDDMLAQIMKQKGSHKQILYTGKRNNGQSAHVSKLFDLCVKVLVDTLDDLPNRISIYNTTHDFPVAFDLVKPVLERANAKQLENCEYYSPNLLSETDYIWKKVCEREFRKLEPPEEDESWRDLYFRKLDERDREFERARRLISSKQQQKPKERQTQLATVKFISANKAVRNVKTTEISTMRVIPSDSGSSMRKSSSSAVGTSGSRFGPPQPPMSQGRKAIMKLIKKSTRR